MNEPKRELALINPNAAGIDLGADTHWVSVPEGRGNQSVHRFGCFTAQLYEMASWLKHCGIETVAMEATGVYWIAVFQILETQGLEVKLVNARHLKTVPGRKSDVLDGSAELAERLPMVATVAQLRFTSRLISSR